MGEILDAARTVFSHKGFENASMAEIARAVGVSEAAIYKYFESKRHLLLNVIREWYHTMIADNILKMAGVVGVRARVHLLIWQHLKTIRDASDLCRLFYSEVRSRPDYIGSELHQLNREATRLLMTEIEQGMAEGLLRHDVSARLLRDVVFGGIEHHVAAFLAGRAELDCDELATSITNLVFDGMRSAARQETTADLAQRLERVATRLERVLKPSRAA